MPLLIAFDHLHVPQDIADFREVTGAPSRPEPTVLTVREREVAELLARGMSARSIGRVLGISPRTVGKHLEHIYVKLGEHDRLMVAMQLSPTTVPDGAWGADSRTQPSFSKINSRTRPASA